jgi:N-glycosylase/DNA lyase
VRRYFGLDDDLPAMVQTFPDDPPMRQALAFGRGLRILRQPIWECLATFIMSTVKQVAHIRQMSAAVRRRLGRPVTGPGLTLHTFPSPQRIASAGEKVLRDCGLGYRARYLAATAELVARGAVNLDALAGVSADEARAILLMLPGVGEKVANCVLLFACGHWRAFPIDFWIERVLQRLYFPHKRRVTPLHLREFASTHFGPYGGYAQQYLFHYARMTGLRSLTAHED